MKWKVSIQWKIFTKEYSDMFHWLERWVEAITLVLLWVRRREEGIEIVGWVWEQPSAICSRTLSSLNIQAIIPRDLNINENGRNQRAPVSLGVVGTGREKQSLTRRWHVQNKFVLLLSAPLIIYIFKRLLDESKNNLEKHIWFSEFCCNQKFSSCRKKSHLKTKL